MTAERAVLVGVEATGEAVSLVADLESARARARKAEGGDRFDIVRFESIATQLEQLAARSEEQSVAVPFDSSVSRAVVLGNAPDSWGDNLPAALVEPATAMLREGRIPVLVVTPFQLGQPEHRTAGTSPPPPAQRWESENGARGRKAVEERFRAQIEEALNDSGPTASARPVSPSGIQNPVVTEILREYVASLPGHQRRNVPIEYRDGSRSAHTFELRSLDLTDRMPATGLELRFALLSIRHAEMDAVVHGAWLRNAEVSRPRPAAQTDDLVYEISRSQLEALTQRGNQPIVLQMYQTGLETAVVGFYKALTDHLLEHPGSAAVQPMYYASRSPRRSSRTTSERTPERTASTGRRDQRSAQGREPERLVARNAPFTKGTPWAM